MSKILGAKLDQNMSAHLVRNQTSNYQLTRVMHPVVLEIFQNQNSESLAVYIVPKWAVFEIQTEWQKNSQISTLQQINGRLFVTYFDLFLGPFYHKENMILLQLKIDATNHFQRMKEQQQWPYFWRLRSCTHSQNFDVSEKLLSFFHKKV